MFLINNHIKSHDKHKWNEIAEAALPVATHELVVEVQAHFRYHVVASDGQRAQQITLAIIPLQCKQKMNLSYWQFKTHSGKQTCQ